MGLTDTDSTAEQVQLGLLRRAGACRVALCYGQDLADGLRGHWAALAETSG